jgi:hypothetical protein
MWSNEFFISMHVSQTQILRNLIDCFNFLISGYLYLNMYYIKEVHFDY